MSRERRREGRERALALAYEAEAKGIDAEAVLAALPVPPEPYAAELVRGAFAAQGRVDPLIRRLARGWKLERMPAIDRTVLRIAGYELAERTDIPVAVIINEAVELAKRFSTDASGRFVNGVLVKMAAELRPGAAGKDLAPKP